jgi:hypothetical protein
MSGIKPRKIQKSITNMPDRSKKYQKSSSVPMPHAGKLLRGYMTSNHIKGVDICESLGVADNAVSDYCRRESLQLGILWKISVALEHNFFTAFADALPFGPDSAKTVALQQEIALKDRQIEDLQKELGIYKKLINRTEN